MRDVSTVLRCCLNDSVSSVSGISVDAFSPFVGMF